MKDDSITIQKRNNHLVVDSRLVAKELGINHKTFVDTIRHYVSTIESAFGCLALETRNVELPNGGTRNDFSHYWLTEDQATFVMTLSRNTEQVVQCKVNLVKAFSDAKKRLEQPINNAYTARLKYSAEKIQLPPNHWCIFDECSKLMGTLEKYLPIDKFDLIDGSVGKRWSNYRHNCYNEGQSWVGNKKTYIHPFPDKRGDRLVTCYHINELPQFRMWYHGQYCQQYLWDYLKDKYNLNQVEKVESFYFRNQLVGV